MRKNNKSGQPSRNESENTLLLQLIYITIIFALLSGCTTKYHTTAQIPHVALPQGFSESGDQQLEQVWWQEMGDENLQRMVERALENNQSLKETQERLRQAEAQARRVGAELYPSVDLDSSARTSRSRENGITTNFDSFLFGVAASYEIDLWGRLRANEDGALLDAQASAADYRAARLSLAAQVANTWYLLASSYRQEKLLGEQQEVNKIGLELVRVRFNAGQITIADLLQQKQLIESTNGELAEQRATSRVLENQLAILTGVAPGTLELPGKPNLIKLPSLPATGLPIDLLSNRPDIQSSYLSLQAADRRVAAAIADRYPRLSITAELNTSGAKTRDLFNNWLASIAGNLIGPIIDGGARVAEVERTEAVAREKLYGFGDAVLTAVGEVEDALIQEKQQLQLISSLEIQLDLASKTVGTLVDRYKQGTTNYQRILDAVLSQQSLQRNLVTSKQQLISFRIDLYRALGGQSPEKASSAAETSKQSLTSKL